MMAAPLVVSKEVIGRGFFLHDSDHDFFNDDLAAKATILGGQLGSLLEASRLTESRAKNIVAPKSWPKSPTRCTESRTSPPWWKQWPTAYACCCGRRWCAYSAARTDRLS